MLALLHLPHLVALLLDLLGLLKRSTKTATLERRTSGTTGVLMKSTAPSE